LIKVLQCNSSTKGGLISEKFLFWLKSKIRQDSDLKHFGGDLSQIEKKI
jgi:hypothetical protein